MATAEPVRIRVFVRMPFARPSSAPSLPSPSTSKSSLQSAAPIYENILESQNGTHLYDCGFFVNENALFEPLDFPSCSLVPS
jgi:hypothetical protein